MPPNTYLNPIKSLLRKERRREGWLEGEGEEKEEERGPLDIFLNSIPQLIHKALSVKESSVPIIAHLLVEGDEPGQ